MKRILYSILILFSTMVSIPLSAQVSLTKRDVKCNGEKNGKVTVTNINNATYPIQNYAWSNGKSGASLKTIENIGGGTYTVTVTDANQCTGTASIVVEEPESSLSLDISSSADEFYLCGTSSIIVVATPSGGTPPYSTNGDNGAYAQRVSLTTFGGGPKFLDFQTSDANGCTKKHRQYFAFSAIACSSDPNDITGPIGIRDERWVAAKDRIDYTIRFENDPELATAPAQVVKVSLPVDPNINPFTIALSDFGWGPYQFKVPANSTFYQARLNLVDSIGLYVDVTAGYNINANEFFWSFESIDPVTGQVPVNPLLGFLPINDSLTAIGEGFIEFSVLPSILVETGDSVSAQAEIIFDVNESIFTNAWVNYLDALAPASELHDLQDSSENNVIALTWDAVDDPGGVGVADFEVLVSIDGSVLTKVADNIDTAYYTYTAEPGFTYGFMVLATDSVGNREAIKQAIEDSIYVIPVRSIDLLAPLGHDLCVYDTLLISWHDVTTDTIRLEMSLDSGEQYFVLADSLIDDAFELYLHDTLIADHVFLRLTDIHLGNVELVSQKLSIHALPVVDAGDNVNVCAGDFTILAASGANTYHWEEHATLNLFEVYNPRSVPEVNTTYYVTGTDVFGCTDSDSVNVSILPVYLDSIVHLMCNEDSLFVGGDYQTLPGFYTDELAASTGCDSTVVTEIVLTGPCPFPAPRIYVDIDAMGLNNGTSWANAFTDLQDALAAVEYYVDVTEIWIAEGIYTPTAGIDRDTSFVLRDSVVIYGGFVGIEDELADRVADPAMVVLSGDIGMPGDSMDNVYHVIVAKNNCITCALDGLTVSFGLGNGSPPNQSIGAGVWVEGKLVLENLVIERNSALLDGAAIYNTGTSAMLTIRDCLFRLNTSGLERDILNTNGATINFQGMNTVQD